MNQAKRRWYKFKLDTEKNEYILFKMACIRDYSIYVRISLEYVSNIFGDDWKHVRSKLEHIFTMFQAYEEHTISILGDIIMSIRRKVQGVSLELL